MSRPSARPSLPSPPRCAAHRNAIRSAISGLEIRFSKPSGIKDNPVLVSSSTWLRRMVSWAPSPRRSVKLVAVWDAMIPE